MQSGKANKKDEPKHVHMLRYLCKRMLAQRKKSGLSAQGADQAAWWPLEGQPP
jgi:hypothetical protein